MYIFGEIESGNRHGAMVVSVVLLACSLAILIALNRLQRRRGGRRWPLRSLAVPSLGPTAADTRRGRSASAAGPRLLITAVLGWFAVLILVPALALVRQGWPGAGGHSSRRWPPRGPARLRPDAGHHGCWRPWSTRSSAWRSRWFWSGNGSGAGRWPTAWSICRSPSRRSSPGLMLVVVYGPQGWLGRWHRTAGCPGGLPLPGMLLATMFVTLPFVVREVVPVLREFGVDQEEVAYTLGAGRWRTFWRVTLPSIRWGLAYGVTLTVARSLGEFGALLVVSGNILGRTQTATLYIHDGIESFHTEGRLRRQPACWRPSRSSCSWAWS